MRPVDGPPLSLSVFIFQCTAATAKGTHCKRKFVQTYTKIVFLRVLKSCHQQESNMEAGPTLLSVAVLLSMSLSFIGLLICTVLYSTQIQGENEFLASNPHIDELDKIEDAVNTAHHPPVTWQWTWLE